MDSQQIYEECIKAHALKWIGEYQDLDPIEYLEFRAGPVLSHFIGVYGIVKIVNDFIQSSNSER